MSARKETNLDAQSVEKLSCTYRGTCETRPAILTYFTINDRQHSDIPEKQKKMQRTTRKEMPHTKLLCNC